ncbi:hypothetical protein [Rubritalea tangerina]|uniref:hypothetical protein n=1 Tax=Rubritalea tangerina TaxID=430798 RepID=UPI00360951D8
MSLSQSSNSWVAGHRTNGVEILSQHRNRAAKTRSSQSSLHTSVACTNDEDVVFFRIAEHSGRNLLPPIQKASRDSPRFHVEQWPGGHNVEC